MVLSSIPSSHTEVQYQGDASVVLEDKLGRGRGGFYIC